MIAITNDDSLPSEFKKQFKFYKKRDSPLDISAVLDPYKPSEAFNIKFNFVSEKYLNDVKLRFKGISGLRPICQWSLTTFLNRPGLFIIGGVLTLTEQLLWIKRCLLEYPEPPNITNLIVQNNNPYKGSNVFKNNLKKLRWVTLGNDYNWETKKYSDVARQSLPIELIKLSQLIVCSLGLDDNFSPDAAIVNFYTEKSHLSPHVDRSERNLTHPLVSISLGQSAIYLTGGTSLNDPVDSIILRSGDILIMSGEQRLVYHAVPRIIDEIDKKIYFNEQIEDKDVLEYANNCRINITIRQVDN